MLPRRLKLRSCRLGNLAMHKRFSSSTTEALDLAPSYELPPIPYAWAGTLT